jgi:hypothetical protein
VTTRELRAELESLQTELKEARATLARLENAEDAELEPSKAKLTRAAERRAAAVFRKQALHDERAQLEADEIRLKRELVEQSVLARGAKLRDQNVDWATTSATDHGPKNSTWTAQLGVAAFFGLMLLGMLLASVCGKHH